MAVRLRLRRLAVVVTGLTLLIGSAACGNPLRGGFGSEPGGVPRKGPAAAWTIPVAAGGKEVAVQGDTVVVTDEHAVRGLDLATGEQRWRGDVTEDYSITIAGDQVVQQIKNGPLEVLDPTTGTTRWRDDRPGWSHVVRQEAVYADDCGALHAAGQAGCTVEAHAPADGRVRWRTPAVLSGGVVDHRIGSRKPVAPASGPYLLAGVGRPGRPLGAVDTRTGRLLKGRLGLSGWHTFAVGDVLVSTDHDPPSGDERCTVRVDAVDAATGVARWSGEIFSARRSDGACRKTLANRKHGAALIGTGSRVAAVTGSGRPQVVDLATGRSVWTAERQGAPIDGDGRSLLVRQSADEGPLTLLDFDSGRVRWEAPDTGLSGDSASWASAVSGKLVAVSGATGDRPFVLVHDVETGRQLGKFPSWLAGLGDDWVAVTRSDGHGGWVLEFVRF